MNPFQYMYYSMLQATMQANLQASLYPIVCLQNMPYSPPRNQNKSIESAPVQVAGTFPSPLPSLTSVQLVIEQSKKDKVKINRQIKSVREKQAPQDQQFTKTKKKPKRTQKQGRNSNSNLLRMFFRKIQLTLKRSPSQIETILLKRTPTLTLDQFKKTFSILKLDFRNYISLPSVRNLMMNRVQDGQFRMVLRIMLKRFVEEEAICSYLTSRKIKKEEMGTNLGAVRGVCVELFRGPLYWKSNQSI